jgi:Fe-S-cluster containining protein
VNTIVAKQDNFPASGDKQHFKAGIFSAWLRRTRVMLLKDSGVSVPCGLCRGCCTSSKFVHIRPEEVQTLSRIPDELLFAAPFLPKGTMVLGYDKNGHCPMLIENRCSIYEYRPLTCRNYDCRIFCAAGILPDKNDSRIRKQVQSWQFSYPYANEHALHKAVRDGARFITHHAGNFPGKRIPTDLGQLAILALKVYELFLDSPTDRVRSDNEIANAIVQANAAFETKRNQLKPIQSETGGKTTR